MASPKIEVFFLYNESTGTPLTGQVGLLTFDTYVNDLGAAVTQPSFTEIGGGAYFFTPVFANPNRGIVYIVNSGAGATPARVARFMRPEDWTTDDISTLLKYQEGRWKVFTSGPDANRLVIYDTDNVTVLKKFDLLDNTAAPGVFNILERTPV